MATAYTTSQAISIADEIASAATIPYRWNYAWQRFNTYRETSHPVWNNGQLIRAGVSLAPVPNRH